jgi:hypothetical protein
MTLVPRGEADDRSGFGIYISTGALAPDEMKAISGMRPGELVFVRGQLEFDANCWNVDLPRNMIGVCAPESHPVALSDAVIAKVD